MTRRVLFLLCLAGALAPAVACGTAATTGRSPAYLVIDNLEGASGATPDEFGNIVSSDVLTLVENADDPQGGRIPTVFADPGRVTFRLGLKDPGTPDSPTAPSPLNEITVTRYRVSYVRTDGRSTPGVDVPYAFEGGLTVTVPAGGTVTAGFELVRHQTKEEPPIMSLIGNGGAMLISTIAEVTFYGRDQAGHDVSVSGRITVNFGDFGDP